MFGACRECSQILEIAWQNKPDRVRQGVRYVQEDPDSYQGRGGLFVVVTVAMFSSLAATLLGSSAWAASIHCVCEFWSLLWTGSRWFERTHIIKTPEVCKLSALTLFRFCRNNAVCVLVCQTLTQAFWQEIHAMLDPGFMLRAYKCTSGCA